MDDVAAVAVVPGRDSELLGQQPPLTFAGRDAAEPEGPPESKAPRRIGAPRRNRR